MDLIDSTDVPAVAPPFLAGDLALDFINSEFGVGDGHRECLTSDAAVLAWLATAGVLPNEPPRERPGELLRAALALRGSARDLVERRKAGSTGDVSILNRVLALGSAFQELHWARGKAPVLAHRHRVTTPESLLVPVAEALSALLAEGDFELVRKCESDDCTQWFYDRTKSHHRRWCSPALCGNRMKVAAFRARQRAQ